MQAVKNDYENEKIRADGRLKAAIEETSTESTVGDD